MTRTFWLACLLALGITSFPLSAAARDGRVLSLQGAATVNGAPMTRSTPINGGDRIDTGFGSQVEVMMNDGTVLEIGPDTAFKVESFSYRKEEPSSWTSSFSLLRGAMRYVSGLIAKRDSKKVRIGAGTATIGIRGSYVKLAFDGVTLIGTSELGQLTFTRAGVTQVVPQGSEGTLNTNTGQSSTRVAEPTDTTKAAQAVADAKGDKAKVKAALANVPAKDQALVFAVLLSNIAVLGVDETKLGDTFAAAAEDNPDIAPKLVFVAAALSTDNTVVDDIVSKTKSAAPGQATKIDQGKAAADNPTEEVPDSESEAVEDNSVSLVVDPAEEEGQEDGDNPATDDPETGTTEPAEEPSPTEPPPS